MSAPPCCICNTTLLYVIDTIATLQPGFGHICADEGSVGGPIEALAVICPLLGGMNVVWPCKGPKDTILGSGVPPPGFTHCSCAVPPDEVRNAALTTLPNPAALKVAVRLKLVLCVIVGVPIKVRLLQRQEASWTLSRVQVMLWLLLSSLQ